MKEIVMKKAGLIIVTVLLLSVVFAACDNDNLASSAGSGTAPVISAIFTSTSENNCLNEVKTNVFNVGNNVWVGIVVTDPDKDVVSATFIFGKAGGQSETETFNASAMQGETVVYAANGGYWEDGDQGTWRVAAYVTDSAGHKSNTAEHSVTVK
jgi:ABC-type oligopeptide transport system substrate-binding subunit